MLWIILTVIAALAIVATILFVKTSAEAKGEMKFFQTIRLISVVAILALWGLVTILWSVGNLENRHVAVTSSFGAIDLQTPIVNPGLYFIAPWKSVEEMEVRGLEIDIVTGTAKDESLTKDKQGLGIDVSMPYALNPLYAPHVLARIGDRKHYEDRLKSSAQSALRDSAASFGWAELAVDNRAGFEKDLHLRVSEGVAQQLIGLGFTEDEAKLAFTFLPIQVKKVTVPERITGSQAELAAAQIDLQRQKILTEQADEIALRRTKEGLGVKNMFAQLPIKPESLTENGIANILNSQAYGSQSDAVKMGIETGKITQVTLLVTPNSNNPIALK